MVYFLLIKIIFPLRVIIICWILYPLSDELGFWFLYYKSSIVLFPEPKFRFDIHLGFGFSTILFKNGIQ